MPTNAIAGPQSVVERIAQCVADLSVFLPETEKIAGLGICSPGPVDIETGSLIDPPNLAGLHNAPLRQMLSERLRIPVSLDHDAKSTGLGEFHFGAGRGEQSMVYIIIGTGVGAAGALEAVACIMALNANVIPPTINLDNPDPACDLDYVPHSARRSQIRTALCNCIAFGSKNSALVIKRID